MPGRERAFRGGEPRAVPGAGRAAPDPVRHRVAVGGIEVAAAAAVAAGHQGAVAEPQAVADAGAEGAEAGLRPAGRDVEAQPVAAGASSLPVLRRRGDEVGAAGSFLHW